MPDLPQCEYFLVEYAPSPLRECRVPIGLFLFNSSGRLLRHAFTDDWRRVRCLDPQADLAMISSLPSYFGRLPAERLYDELRRMQADESGGIQISAPRGVLAADPQQEFETLFQEHIAPPPAVQQKRPVREGSRPWIHAQLSDALRRYDLWERFTRDVSVAEFTAPGDRFRIGFSFRPNGVTNYLHAISLDRDWNQAKLLAYTFGRIREKSKASMTAIVADPLETVGDSCRGILEDARIAIQPLSGLDPFLEGIRRELRIQ
ncbi:MAG: DUF3037 domain-containing protein [Acidobacteria bacterium]|nr:DUF3037 domain-containing protein [Acidobacteriota bacterium]